MLSHRILGGRKGILSSCKRDWTHSISAAVLAKLLYSASVLDLATKVCFLELHEIKFGPKKRQELEVDLLSSGSAPQPASQNAISGVGEVQEVGLSKRP